MWPSVTTSTAKMKTGPILAWGHVVLGNSTQMLELMANLPAATVPVDFILPNQDHQRALRACKEVRTVQQGHRHQLPAMPGRFALQELQSPRCVLQVRSIQQREAKSARCARQACLEMRRVPLRSVIPVNTALMGSTARNAVKGRVRGARVDGASRLRDRACA